MPDDWIPNTGTQLERAIRALFVEKGAASVDDCLISNESIQRGGLDTGLTTIRAFASSADEAELSGNEKFQVSIQNKFIATDESGNNKLNRTLMDHRVGRQMMVLMQGGTVSGTLNFACDDINTYGRALATLDAVNEADMTEFTCLFGRYLGMTRGQPDDESFSWVEVRNFEFTCCPSNVD